MSGTSIAIVALLIIVLGYGAYTGINNYFIGLDYQKEIGGFYDYADRSSDGITKSDYFNQYVAALEKHNLTNGSSSIFWADLPKASLTDNFKVVKSLQIRLANLALQDPNTIGYGTQMEQITKQEFCWFPEQVFKQKYFLDKGAWWQALSPVDAYNHCHTSS